MNDFVEKVKTLLTHIEDQVDDETWERISTKIWNDVSCHKVI